MRVAIVVLAAALALSACKTTSNRYADIENAYKARLAALTEAVEQGRMTPAEAQARAAEAEASANTQVQMRAAARRSAFANSGPTICTPVGVSVHCY